MAWNGSDQTDRATSTKSSDSCPRRAVTSSRRTYQRGILAGLLVVSLLGVGLWWIFGGRGATRPTAPTTKSNSQIATATPAAARTNAVPAAVAKTNVVAAKRKRVFKTYRDEKGVLRYEGGMVVRKPPVRTIKVGDHTPSPFKHVAEMQIASLLSIEPGEMVVGTIFYDKNFTDSLKESFEEEIEIKDDDDDKTREIKQAVIDTKKELKDRMDKGEDVCQLMSDTREDLQRLGLYRMELENQVRTILDQKADDGELTDQDVQDCYGAANEMLEAKGVAKLHMPGTMFVRMMRRSAEKRRAEQESQKK